MEQNGKRQTQKEEQKRQRGAESLRSRLGAVFLSLLSLSFIVSIFLSFLSSFFLSFNRQQPRARCLPRSRRARDTLLLGVQARFLKVRVRFRVTRLAGIPDHQLRRALLPENSA